MTKVYIETSIVSYLTARPSNNLIAAAWQKETVDWWETHIDNAEMKPKIRRVMESNGYQCPEIATPMELMGVQDDD